MNRAHATSNVRGLEGCVVCQIRLAEGGSKPEVLSSNFTAPLVTLIARSIKRIGRISISTGEGLHQKMRFSKRQKWLHAAATSCRNQTHVLRALELHGVVECHPIPNMIVGDFRQRTIPPDQLLRRFSTGSLATGQYITRCPLRTQSLAPSAPDVPVAGPVEFLKRLSIVSP